MAELADAQDLGSCIERCVGSSPTGRMIKKAVFADKFLLKAVFLFAFCIPGIPVTFPGIQKQRKPA